MNINVAEPPLVVLPSQVEQTLYLLREELKSHRFFTGLRNLGLDDCYHQTELAPVILANTGLADDANETTDFYYALLDKYSQQIDPSRDKGTAVALSMYIDLVVEKRRREGMS